MSTSKSESFYFCKFVLFPADDDQVMSNWLDRFAEYIKCSPSEFSPFYLLENFSKRKLTYDGYFLIALNKVLAKRGIPYLFSKKDIEYYKNCRDQFDLFKQE